jgi:hypothetical protein
MSVVFDCFHWYRREFGTVPDNKNSAYESEIVKEKAREELAQYQSSSNMLSLPNTNQTPDSSSNQVNTHMPSAFFEDWDWVSSIPGFDFQPIQFPHMNPQD